MSNKLQCVLLIDDDEDDNFFHQIIIERMNIAGKVQVAESGEEALEILSENAIAPELIFLDINMPKMNGWEFLNRFNELNPPESRSTVIIILTTSVNPVEKELSKSTPGIAGFISKPVTEELLTALLRKHFSKSFSTGN